jgi:ribulose-phosphate 3-epimerase
MKNIALAPSLLAADFANLSQQIKILENAEVQVLHLDVMDGHFVPNITMGPCVIKSIRNISNITFDTHLMIENPENYIQDFAQAGSNWITVHMEAISSPKVLEEIKKLGCKAGLAIKPNTSVDTLLRKEFLDNTDLILIMSVEPGFGGQKFIPDVLQKVTAIREKKPEMLISIDGGINLETGQQAIAAGVDILVAGSAIFRQSIENNIKEFYRICGKK